jgi:dUTP pyrophosphatase
VNIDKVEILITRLDPDLPLPSYAKAGDAGADLVSRIDFTIQPGERMLVPTGIAIAMPIGHVAFVHPRSGLAIKHGISMVNTPGTIDAGYRGELQVILINHDRTQAVSFKRGDRIAQIVFQKVSVAQFIEVSELPGSERAEGGFGSTGTASVNQEGY